MSKYMVQYELPVDNPTQNVSISKSKELLTFFVPLNHPDAHNMGFQDLIAAWELGGKHVLSTALNNTVTSSQREKISKAVAKLAT